MKTLELSPRLRAVARCIPEGCRLADVGTDHAYLPAWLILNEKIDSAIASDLREGPLGRARATAQRYGVTGRMEFRLCDGLRAIGPEEVDAVSIAGMGGETIADILAQAPWTKERLLALQPMTSLPELRHWLQRNGYRILREHVALDQGTIYLVMSVTGGVMESLTPGEGYAGRPACWVEEPLRGAYLEHLLAKAGRELAGVERSSKAEDLPRMDTLRQIITELKKWKGEWEHAHGGSDL